MRMDHGETVSETVLVRNLADRVLNGLLREREASEERQAEAGVTDPMKSITGASAMDRAIARTNEILQRAEAMLTESPAGR